MKSKLKVLLGNATWRLALRAALAAVTVLASGYLHTGSLTRGLLTGAVLAFVEIFTPLNSLVGLFSQASPVVDAGK